MKDKTIIWLDKNWITEPNYSDDISKWLSENLGKYNVKWGIDEMGSCKNGKVATSLWFQYVEDAMAFKLAWK